MELTPLRRANTGAMLGGVCASLARRWQVDPTIVRIAMVLLAGPVNELRSMLTGWFRLPADKPRAGEDA